jgi:hypothetical protein
MGHKGPIYKAKVHQDRKGSNPNANPSINQWRVISYGWDVMTCNLIEFTDVWKKHVATILQVQAACGKILIRGRVDWVG